VITTVDAVLDLSAVVHTERSCCANYQNSLLVSDQLLQLMSGRRRGRSTSTNISRQRLVGRWLVVAVVLAGLAAVVWLPGGATATTTTNVTTVDTVEDFESDHEFIGVVRDPADLQLTATLTADGQPVTGNVTVQFVRDGTVLYDAGETTVENGEFSETIDPAAFPIETPPGKSTVELGSEPAGTIGLYHEVEPRSEGIHPISVPQPAQLSVDGEFRATKWDSSTGSYSSSGLDQSGDFSTASDLHEGLYLIAEEPIRVGFEFEPESDGATAPTTESIRPGWTLLGSNYDISSNDYLAVVDDLSIAGEDVDAYSPAGEPLADSHPIYPYDAYWVYSDSTIDRGITTRGYNATARGR